MNPPLVSCIIPVYNGEKNLAESIESVLGQSVGHVEVIVVDDGSTDGSGEVAASYGERIRYLKQANAGPASARETGRNVAVGDFIAYLDSDDLWHPEKLERQLERFEARPELDISTTHIQNFWADEVEDEAERFAEHRISRPLPGYVTVTTLAKRSVFERIGGLNVELLHGDSTEWFVRARQHGLVIELMPDVLVQRRLHRSNRSRADAGSSRDEFLEIIKAKLDRERLKSPDTPAD